MHKLFFFNLNNATQMNVLEDIGVKNVIVSYRYTKNILDDILTKFDKVILIPGKIKNDVDYYDYVKVNGSKFHFCTQLDSPMDMKKTIELYQRGKEFGADIVPILTENYITHLSLLKLTEPTHICLGRMYGKIEEDEQIRRLPRIYKYHGMAKARFLNSTVLDSIDSSAWLSGVKGRKTEVFASNSRYQVNLEVENSSQIDNMLIQHRKHIDGSGVTKEKLLNGDYDSLLKIQHLVYYKPLFKHTNIISDNYKR